MRWHSIVTIALIGMVYLPQGWSGGRNNAWIVDKVSTSDAVVHTSTVHDTL